MSEAENDEERDGEEEDEEGVSGRQFRNAFRFGVRVALHLADQGLSHSEIYLKATGMLFSIASGEETLRGTPADERADFQKWKQHDDMSEEMADLRETYANAENWLPVEIRRDRDQAQLILGGYWHEPDDSAEQ